MSKHPPLEGSHLREGDQYLGILNWSRSDAGGKGSYRYHIWLSKDEKDVAWQEISSNPHPSRLKISSVSKCGYVLSFVEPLLEMIELHTDPSVSPGFSNVSGS